MIRRQMHSKTRVKKIDCLHSTDPPLALKSWSDRKLGIVSIHPNASNWSFTERSLKLGYCRFMEAEVRPCRIVFGDVGQVRLLLLDKGAVRLECLGASRQLKTSEIAILAQEGPVTLHVLRTARIVFATAPRDKVAQEIESHGLRWNGDDGARLEPMLPGDFRIDEIFRLVCNEIERNEDFGLSDGSHRAFGRLFIGAVAGCLSRAIQASRTGDEIVATTAPQTVKLCCGYIERNFAQPISLSALANIAGVSTRTLQIQFRKQFNCTISEYIRDHRLAQAHQRLSEAKNGDTVSSIARFSGFDHLGDFAAVFRDKYGKRPNEVFRKALRGAGAR